jgi:GNAT superfamily N-acetyltransferase
VSSTQIRPLRSAEIGAFARLGNYAFDGRSVEQRLSDFTIVSQLMLYEIGTWIDGVRDPTGGLANVATIPERARRGYASRLLRATLAWMRDELGQRLSTLFPTVHALYAGLGWALAERGAHYIRPAPALRPAPGLRAIRANGLSAVRRPPRTSIYSSRCTGPLPRRAPGRWTAVAGTGMSTTFGRSEWA